MTSLSEWQVPPGARPRPEDYAYDLESALAAVVGVTATVPDDAFTAEALGPERVGNGVLIRSDGVVLTIGYLITEAETVWLNLIDGRVVPGHVLAYDQQTGFGLVQALTRLDLPVLPLGQSSAVRVGERVVIAGAGGPAYSLAARIVAKQEFAGYWEYLLDEAIFTAPAHPHWGGAAMIGPDGDLLGIGSLQLEQVGEEGRTRPLNMVVPIDLLKPILDDLVTFGRPNRPSRPWLGLYAAEVGDKVAIAGLATGGPAARADLRPGDIVLGVAGVPVSSLAGFYRRVWSLGEAGVEVPLTVQRDDRILGVRVHSADRNKFLKAPKMH